MSLTGIPVDDECLAAFQEMKTKKAYRYLVMAIVENKVKVVEKGARAETYENFLTHIGKDQPCYAVFDYEWESSDGKRDKIVLISWIPDTAKVKSKMMYAGTKESVKSVVEGGIIEIQATDASEVAEEAVRAKVA
jgi:cofilin